MHGGEGRDICAAHTWATRGLSPPIHLSARVGHLSGGFSMATRRLHIAAVLFVLLFVSVLAGAQTYVTEDTAGIEHVIEVLGDQAAYSFLRALQARSFTDRHDPQR